MSNTLFVALTILAALGSGVVAGIFFAFSTFVMTALSRLRSDQGISAMQSINITVLNPWFFAAFFGTAAGCVVLAVIAILNWGESEEIYLLAGSLLYLVGSILVTIVFNVPLNKSLAAVKPDSTEGGEFWSRYLSVWTTWNHVRTLASLSAMASFIMALR